MSNFLKGKVAIVTGAATGLGRVIALSFHHEGATVVVADINEKAAIASDPSTQDLITQEGGKSLFVKTDVTSSSNVEALVEHTVKQYGRLDIFVNNAGVAPDGRRGGPIWEFNEDLFDLAQRVNVKGTMLGCKYASRQMVKQDPLKSGHRGWIVNLASVYGLVGEGNVAGYVTSKHAVVGLTKVVAIDCAPHRINVNAVCPGYLTTTMTDHVRENEQLHEYIKQKHLYGEGGLGDPQDVANVIVFLASDRNTWMTGAAVPVDGGFTSV